MSTIKNSLANRIAIVTGLLLLCVQLIDAAAAHRFGNLLELLRDLVLAATLTMTVYLWVKLTVSQPLREIAQALEKASRGDSLQRIPSKRGDEIGLIARSFNLIQTQLTEIEASKIDTDVELEIAQRELELKSQLEDKNRIIEQTNVKLYERINQLQLLFDLAAALAATLKRQQIVEVLEQHLVPHLGQEGYLLVATDDKGNNLQVLSGRGVFETAGEAGSIAHHRSLVTRSLRHRQLVNIPDLSREPIEPDTGRLAPAQGSLLSVPLLHKDTVLGAITLWRPGHQGFTSHDEQLLLSVAHLASLALVNARLYQEKLDLSVTDELTGLANRRLLDPRLELEWNRARRFETPLSLLMIDIDHFKKYNDRNGHLLGDRVLKEVAGILKSTTRRVDTVARFGGEEFVILLPRQDAKTAFDIAEKLRQAVDQHKFVREDTQPGGKVTISLGVACFPHDADDPHELLNRSDLALYASKQAGRNRTTRFRPEMQEMAEERLRQRQEKRKRRRRKKLHPRRLEIIDPT